MRYNAKNLPDEVRRMLPKEDAAHLGKFGLTDAQIEDKTGVKLERKLQNQIANFLRLKGIVFQQSRMDKKTGNTIGIPDFLFAINGKPIAIEAKRPGGKLSPEQEATIKRMEAPPNSWKVYVVTDAAVMPWIFKESGLHEP